MMGIQFGRDKCVQMHVGKKHNSHICTTCKVDAWDEAVINRDGIIHIEDKYIGEEAIKSTIKNIWGT